MLETFSVLTLQLARAYGLGILVIALAAITGPTRFSEAIADVEKSPGLTLLGAVLALILGIGMVTLHNLWTDPIAILVSLVGWLAFAKGVLILAAPSGLMKLAVAAATPERVRVWGVIMLILAAVYLVPGLEGRATG